MEITHTLCTVCMHVCAIIYHEPSLPHPSSANKQHGQRLWLRDLNAGLSDFRRHTTNTSILIDSRKESFCNRNWLRFEARKETKYVCWSYGMWRHVDLYLSNNVSEKHTASIFRALQLRLSPRTKKIFRLFPEKSPQAQLYINLSADYDKMSNDSSNDRPLW
jgi:hypothetical protein